MFFLLAWGDVSSPCAGRHFFSLSSPAGDGSCGRIAVSNSRFFFSLFFFLPPSVDTARNRPSTVEIDRYRSQRSATVEIDRYRPTATDDGRNRPLPFDSDRRRSKSIVTGRFRVVTGWKQPQLAVSPGTGRSAYWSTGRPVFLFNSTLFLQNRIISAVAMVEKERSRRLGTSVLNQVVQEALAFKPPPRTRGGKRGRVYYSTQAAIRPPTFVFFVNDAKLFPETYRRYMEKQLRKDAGFPGTPIRLLWRSRRRGDKGNGYQ
ncbi:hypothetical protein B296_00055239 [Ensete ventricosum]|uniref:GTPase Der C-terminal KH-domain-like domain-containing protein n=1 Tax=Ensete ventricosum TaxID=4639 RepID=A0A426Y0W2_ENSVE|nr:hypothetical protein B296_00055239 [Ensete ventricosum]